MKPHRSMLFVPGHKDDLVDKAIATGTDAIILDLEDSVPPAEKETARSKVAATLDRLERADRGASVWVRPNSTESGIFGEDVEAVIRAGLAGLFLPKVYSAREVIEIDAIVGHIEKREGLSAGTVELLVSFETAQSMSACEDIASASPRIGTLLGATGPNADVGRSVGFEFTPEGLESLYLRSRIVLAARANGLDHPIGGVWQDIRNIDGLRSFALDQRRLGYRGLAVIHPSHVATVNEVFTPSQESVDYSRRLISEFRKAEADGAFAIQFEGQMIDLAHIKTAEEVIALADAIAS